MDMNLEQELATWREENRLRRERFPDDPPRFAERLVAAFDRVRSERDDAVKSCEQAAELIAELKESRVRLQEMVERAEDMNAQMLRASWAFKDEIAELRRDLAASYAPCRVCGRPPMEVYGEHFGCLKCSITTSWPDKAA